MAFQYNTVTGRQNLQKGTLSIYVVDDGVGDDSGERLDGFGLESMSIGCCKTMT